MSNANEPAYPARLKRTDREYGTAEALYPRLTKREYFAAMAMQGLCADHKRFDDLTMVIESIHGQQVGSMENARTLRNLIAKMAIGHADALIAELERTA